jgi:hypothetical protein
MCCTKTTDYTQKMIAKAVTRPALCSLLKNGFDSTTGKSVA